MPSLIVVKGTDLGEFHTLGPGEHVVGRTPGLAVHLHDMTVSRRHLRIACPEDGAAATIEDLGSTHGVRVNDVRIYKPIPLTEGDRIRVGSVEMMFTALDVASREEALSVLESQESELATINFSGSAMRAMEAAARGEGYRAPGDLRGWAGSDRATLAIVFTDLVESTSLTTQLGNEAMDKSRRAHFDRVRSLAARLGGFEIKSNGDGFLLAFHAAVPAVDFSSEVVRDPGDPSLRVRAGVHVGPVVVEDDDVQGAAVSYAARLMDQARTGGLRISDEVKDHLEQEKAVRHGDLSWRRRPEVQLRGFPGPQVVWELREGAGRS
jgi:class 3 adenylate cyclase